MQGSPSETTSKDLTIAQLRQEVSELRDRAAQVPELTEKLANLEFTLQVLTGEKQAAERETSAKSEQNLKVISQLRSEVDLLSRKLNSEESKSKLTKSSLAEYDLELTRAREEKAKSDREVSRLTEALREAQAESKR